MKLPFSPGAVLDALKRAADAAAGVFSFSRKEIAAAAAVFGVVLVAAVVVTVVSGRGDSPGRPSPGGYSLPEGVVFSEERVDISEFLLSGPPGGSGVPDYVLFRVPQESWTDEQVERYWIDMRETGRGLLEIEAERGINELFEKYD